jgi:hypothetical protein
MKTTTTMSTTTIAIVIGPSPRSASHRSRNGRYRRLSDTSPGHAAPSFVTGTGALALAPESETLNLPTKAG